MAKTVDVNTHIEINAPIEKVADYAFNPDNAPEWYVNINSVEWKTEKPLRIGSQVTFKAKFMGKQLEYTYAFVELEPQKKLVMKTAEGPFPMQTTYELEDLGGGKTRMKLRNNGEPSGFSKLMAPLMTRMMRNANQKDLIMIKSILEQ